MKIYYVIDEIIKTRIVKMRRCKQTNHARVKVCKQNKMAISWVSFWGYLRLRHIHWVGGPQGAVAAFRLNLRSALIHRSLHTTPPTVSLTLSPSRFSLSLSLRLLVSLSFVTHAHVRTTNLFPHQSLPDFERKLTNSKQFPPIPGFSHVIHWIAGPIWIQKHLHQVYFSVGGRNSSISIY